MRIWADMSDQRLWNTPTLHWEGAYDERITIGKSLKMTGERVDWNE